jgi:alpha-glucosidase
MRRYLWLTLAVSSAVIIAAAGWITSPRPISDPEIDQFDRPGDPERGGQVPWLPMNDDRSRNVARQADEERSILQLFRHLIDLRRREPCLVDGKYRPCRSRNDILSYQRVSGHDRISVALNISNEPRRWECSEPGERLISTNLDRDREPVAGPILLRANEGILVKHG